MQDVKNILNAAETTRHSTKERYKERVKSLYYTSPAFAPARDPSCLGPEKQNREKLYDSETHSL
jgi:hypothetical protein